MSLQSLFGNLGDFKDDLMTFGVAGAGAVGGVLAYNALFDLVLKQFPSMQGGMVEQYGRPVGAVVLGIFAGNWLMRRGGKMRDLGTGVSVGLVANALSILVSPMIAKALPAPQAATAGLGDPLFNRYLNGAPIDVEEVSGAPTSVENVAGFGGGIERVLTY